MTGKIELLRPPTKPPKFSAMELAGAIDSCSRAHDRNSAIPRIERMLQEWIAQDVWQQCQDDQKGGAH